MLQVGLNSVEQMDEKSVVCSVGLCMCCGSRHRGLGGDESAGGGQCAFSFLIQALLGSQGQAQTPNLPLSASLGLKLQACAATPGFVSLDFFI